MFEVHKTYFEDWKAVRAAINDFNESYNKSCRLVEDKKNDRRRTFVCSDSRCGFKLVFSRKKHSGGIRRTNVSHDQPMVANFVNIKESILYYLMKLHPTQFSVAGNVELTEEDQAILRFIWGPCGLNGYGERKALFGHRTTNGVEGENNGLLHDGFRFHHVYDAVYDFLDRYVFHF